MTPDEARKLLGGYATGTLTSVEQQALFAAALEDQALFEELAREQVFRDALEDPAARAALLDAVSAPRRPAWMRWWVPAGAGAMALAGLTVAVLLQKEPAVEMARVEAPAQVAESAPPTAQEPETKAKKPVRQAAPVERDQAEDKRVADAVPPLPEPSQAKTLAKERAEVAAAPMAIRASVEARQSAAEQLFETGMRADAPGSNMSFAAGAARAQKKSEDAAAPVLEAAPSPIPGPGLKYSISAAGITAEPNLDGFLMVFRRGTGGEWIDAGPGAAPVKARTPVTISRASGAEMVMMLSARRQTVKPADMDALKASAAQTLMGTNGGTHFAVNPNPAALLVVIVGAERK